MKKTLIPTLAALSLFALTAHAEPVKLDKAQMDKVVAGAITEIKVNGGGNVPNGQANGVPSTNVNPTGYPPPGQNK